MEDEEAEIYKPKDIKFRQRTWNQNLILALKVCLVIAVFCIGFIIGWFAMKSRVKDPDHVGAGAEKHDQWTDKSEYHDQLVGSMKSESLEDILRRLTKRPHIGGGRQNKILGEYIRDAWKSYGFDDVEMVGYDVLISITPKNKSNAVKIINNINGDIIVNIQGPEKTAEASENDPLVVPPFLAYSPAGDITGDLVYINYGTTEDFDEFKKLGQTCGGKIAIMRYGKIFRGDKIQNAQECGAIGVLLYSDPSDFAPMGMNDTFPKSWWLPGTGAQRGSIINLDYYGDPLTPLLPSTEGIYRIPFNKTKGIPVIPAQPLPYNDALEFLKRMAGADAPKNWQGSLPIKYRLGPGFTDNNLTVRLVVNNEYVRRVGYNVIGTITGREEPDRIVLFGSHRDAWVFGGVDASSGTAVMMEVSRGLGQLLKETSWRPRRTIMFCSWAVEEYGIIGSAEWVTENEKLLSDRAAMYMNIDSGVAGNYSFSASGSPLLTDMVFTGTKKTKDHNEQDMSVYKKWSMRYPSATEQGEPAFLSLGSGSDYTQFAHSVGIPSIDMSYGFKTKSAWPYPVYHSVHDTFYWQKKFNDPFFKSHLTMAQTCARLLITAVDSPLLPFTTKHYKDALTNGFEQLKMKHQAKLHAKNITLNYIANEITNLGKAADAFEATKAKAKGSAEFPKLRILNDQMMKFERSFIWPYGLPGRPDTRHVLFAPQKHNLYGRAVFPGINDVMYDINSTGKWMELKKQVSIVIHALRASVNLLKPLTKE